MGPIELLFLTVMALFGAIGVVRGYSRELGVTTMLLVTLFLIEFLFTGPLADSLNSWLAGRGVTEAQIKNLQAAIAVTALIVVTFISYQGFTLTFVGGSSSPFLGLLVGLLNGYLFAGSIWYYLAQADWPLIDVELPYTTFYDFVVQLLPPAIFGWEFFILVAAGLLILKVAK